MSHFEEGWYLLYSKPRHEKKVSQFLTELDINFLLPTVKKLHQWHDRKKYVDMALFPSYIFVRLKDIREYYDGLNVEGVLHYVKFGKAPARVSEEVIESIRLLVGQGVDMEVSYDHFLPGRRFLIQEGPLTGLSCEVVQYKGIHKILVRVHLLQRNLLATLPLGHLCEVPSGDLHCAEQ